MPPSPDSQTPASQPLSDAFGRQAGTLRISVTDRCNFRCTYCMPTEDMTWFPREGILQYEEIERVVRLLVPHGVTRLRLTGGEPTLRRDLCDLVTCLSNIPGIERLSMTTNAVNLPKLAPQLKDAGLDVVTISLDSLRQDRFEELTKRDALDQVLKGIHAARSAGFDSVKVNVVTLKGVNDDELIDFARFAREHDLAVRFIEFMPLDGGAGWGIDRVLPGKEARAAIEEVFPLVAREERPEAPARPFRFADGAPGEVGFISPVTEPFCGTCDRIRLTADGKIKNCMFDDGEVNLLAPLREGASNSELLDRLRTAMAAKGKGGLIELKPAQDYAHLRNMSRLGG